MRTASTSQDARGSVNRFHRGVWRARRTITARDAADLIVGRVTAAQGAAHADTKTTAQLGGGRAGGSER